MRPNEPHHTLTKFLYPLAIVWFLTFACFQTTYGTYEAGNGLVKIVRFQSAIVVIAAWGAMAIAIILVLLAVISFWRPLIKLPVVALLLGLVMYPICGVIHTMNNLGPWTVHGQITTNDGTKYAFLDTSFLQAQMMAIAKVTSSGPLTSTYRVLVHNNGDSPRSWASIIRPQPASNDYGQLYLTDAGLLVGVRFENNCYLAYDLKGGIPYGHGKIESLSPFVCLNRSDQINLLDIDRTIDRIDECVKMCERSDDNRASRHFLDGNSIPGCPLPATIRDGLGSDNPAVASAAARLDATMDNAIKRLRVRLVIPKIPSTKD